MVLPRPRNLSPEQSAQLPKLAQRPKTHPTILLHPPVLLFLIISLPSASLRTARPASDSLRGCQAAGEKPDPTDPPPLGSVFTRNLNARDRGMSFLKLLPQRLPQVIRQLEQDVETVIHVLQPGPIGIIEHKFTAAEVIEAKATVKRAVENWRRNWILERNLGSVTFDKWK